MPASWIAFLAATWAVTVGLVVVVFGLGRRVRILETSMRSPIRFGNLLSSAPAIGSKLPSVPGYEGIGQPTLGAGRILLFLTSGCSPCRRLGEQLASLSPQQARALDGVDVVVVTDEQGLSVYESEQVRVVAQRDGELSAHFGVRATPFAIAVDKDGTVRHVMLPNALEDLFALAAAANESPTSGAGSPSMPEPMTELAVSVRDQTSISRN
jgi:hypothetical protein